jgi:hypothetical protein
VLRGERAGRCPVGRGAGGGKSLSHRAGRSSSPWGKEPGAVGKTRWDWPSEIWRMASTTRCCCKAVSVMGKSVIAKVHWVPPEEGGRTSLPTGKKYSTIARFPEDTGTWLQEAWSIVLECDEPPCGAREPFYGQGTVPGWESACRQTETWSRL